MTLTNPITPIIIDATRVSSWNSIGTDCSKCNNMEEVLASSGLDYEVIRMPMFLADGTNIPNRFITARPEQGAGLHLYDVVSDKFEIVQNREAFDFVNFMGNVTFEKAGETASGMVYIIGKLPDVSILGDTFTPHVIFRNGFNAKIKITAAICPLRIVCQNQFNVSFRSTENTVTVRHVSNAQAKLEEAREILRMSSDYMAELNSMAERYANMKLSQTQLDWVINTMFPMGDKDSVDPYKRKLVETSIAAFKKAYMEDDNSNFRGTAWGIVNAYSDFITHKEPSGKTPTRFENKFTKVTFGGSLNHVIDIIDGLAA
jgi:phage/plasmid-like protein (TIGR03299 family)